MGKKNSGTDTKGAGMIKGIAHVCIGTVDLEATRKFYCETLGLPKVFEFEKDGKTIGFYCRVGDNNFLEFFVQGALEPSKKPVIKHLCLETENLDMVIEKLSHAGYHVTEKKLGCDSTWQSWVTDPNGMAVELFEYTDQSSQFTGKNCVVDW